MSRAATPLPTGDARRAPRVRAVLVVVALVILGHAWLIAGLPLGVSSERSRVAALQTRQVAVPVPPPPLPTAPTAPARQPRPPAPADIHARAAEPVPPPAVSPAREAEPPMVAASAPPIAMPAEPASEAAAASAASVPALAAADRDEAPAPPPAPVASGDLPVYATRLPPAATLHYELRRGAIGGLGQLDWRPGSDGYELAIEGTALGVPVLSWLSRGGYDGAGLAPLRFVDRRRARALRAANFQRDSGRITYSGTAIEAPLAPGAQDRLSWVVQLAGIVEADAERFSATGQQVTMQVSGARGDAGIWTFAVVGRETVELASGPVETLLLRRHPRRPYDTLAEVWLDPQRHHLPARLRLTVLPDGDTLEFRLRASP